MRGTERRRRTKRAVLVVIALLLVVYLISSTYARYSTTGLANAKVSVAKWAVALKANGSTTITSTTQDIPFVVQENTNVVAGKIAPSVTAVATFELDLTGTEVAVDFTATVGDLSLTGLPSADKITFTSTLTGGTPGTIQTIALPNGAAFTSENGVKTLTLTLTWTNDDTNNVDDTATGMLGDAARTLTIPVTLTVQQHISA